MAKRNPYLNRSMIRSVDGFFGRRRALDRIMARLGDATPQSVSVVGDRRVGKSSLLWYLSQVEVSSRYLDEPGAYVFVYLDFQGQRHLDMDGFSSVFRRQLADAVGDRAEVAEATDLTGLERCIQRLASDGLRVVGLFDEFETVTSSAAFGPEFFGFLRSLANSYPVAYVTASRRQLQALCRSQEISESPFFNIFSRVVLGPLEEQEAVDLVGEPSAAAGVDLAPYMQPLRSMGGHLPLFLQIACSAAFEIVQETGAFDEQRARRRFREEADGHLEYLWEHLEADQRQVLGGLLAGQAPAPDQAEAKRRLLEAGYVREQAGLQPFSDCLGPCLSELGRLDEAAVPPAPETAATVVEPAAASVVDRGAHALRLEPLPPGQRPYPALIGTSEALRRLFTFIDRAAASDVTVLLLGETGTGKELVARTIHDNSQRREGPLVVVNCGAIAEHLQESELFGHRKGSFTGAIADREGLFEAANGGTLLLDEIAETTLATQVKLLRVLQEREIRRIGETRARAVDVRVFGATNRHLEREVEAGRFREDLYYRLCVLVAELPPLRSRREDIPALAAHFVGGAEVAPEVTARLQAYDWPGNVRELENQLASAGAVAGSGPIRAAHLWPRLQQLAPVAGTGVGEAGATAVPGLGDGLSLREAREVFERQLLGERLARFDWDPVGTAGSLGISRSRLYELIRKYGLARPTA